MATLRWVPTQERLPSTDETDRGGFVLAACGSTFPFTIRACRHDGEHWLTIHNYVMHKVFAWTQLPQPTELIEVQKLEQRIGTRSC